MKNKYIVVGVILLLVLVLAYQKINTASSMEAVEFPDAKLARKENNLNFYYDQLTTKEKQIYRQLLKRAEEFVGGVVELEEELSVWEMQRVYKVFEVENPNLFYALPSNVFIDKNGVVLDNQDTQQIQNFQVKKILLILYCSDYHNLEVDAEDNHKVTNLDELDKRLKSYNLEELEKVKARIQQTDVVLGQVLHNIPANATQEETLTYFSEWIHEHLVYDRENELLHSQSDNPREYFEEYLEKSCAISVLDGQALCLGYAKTLAYLCNKVGIDAHVVFGKLKGKQDIRHAVTLVKIQGVEGYIDLSTVWSLGEEKVYKARSEKEVLSRMLPDGDFVFSNLS